MVNKFEARCMEDLGLTTEQQWRAFEEKTARLFKGLYAAHYLCENGFEDDSYYDRFGTWDFGGKRCYDICENWWNWGREKLGSETAMEVFDRLNGWILLSEASWEDTLWDGYEEFLEHDEAEAQQLTNNERKF